VPGGRAFVFSALMAEALTTLSYQAQIKEWKPMYVSKLGKANSIKLIRPNYSVLALKIFSSVAPAGPLAAWLRQCRLRRS